MQENSQQKNTDLMSCKREVLTILKMDKEARKGKREKRGRILDNTDTEDRSDYLECTFPILF